jgi:hypothetical protein
MTIVVEEPGPSRRSVRNVDWASIRDQVKGLKGEWAMVGTFSPGMAHFIRTGKVAAFLPERFDGDREEWMRQNWEVTARFVGRNPARVKVYVRWLGGE